MKRRIMLWSVLVAALLLLCIDFGGSVQTSHTLVKAGGPMNHCDCTYRIQ